MNFKNGEMKDNKIAIYLINTYYLYRCVLINRKEYESLIIDIKKCIVIGANIGMMYQFSRRSNLSGWRGYIKSLVYGISFGCLYANYFVSPKLNTMMALNIINNINKNK